MMNKISINYSPNFSIKKRIKKNIKFIVFHYTGMSSQNKAINRLTNVRSKVSCHYFIKKDGDIILMVPEIFSSWHAGISNWKKYKNLNNYSIGIEIQNSGHQFGYKKYNNNQINSIIKLSKFLIKKYKINKKNFLGHSDIAYLRKKDPGEKFPWSYLSKNGIGIWHNLNKKKLIKLRKTGTTSIDKNKFIFCLKKIGYFIKKVNPNQKIRLIKAFQMRFRPELINGKIDKECLIICEKISKI